MNPVYYKGNNIHLYFVAVMLCFFICFMQAKYSYGRSLSSSDQLAGKWQGTLSSGAKGQSCKYKVTAVIEQSSGGNEYIIRTWNAKRAHCSLFACGHCSKNVSFSNRKMSVVMRGMKNRKDRVKGLEFSTSKEAESKKHVAFLERVYDNKLSGKGNFRDHNAWYDISLSRKP